MGCDGPVWRHNRANNTNYTESIARKEEEEKETSDHRTHGEIPARNHGVAGLRG